MTKIARAALCVLLAACNGTGPTIDAGARDSGRDTGTADTGTADTGTADAGAWDAGSPADFEEPPGSDTDPFLGGSPADTGVSLAPGSAASIDGTIDGAGASEVWADSDAFAFRVTEETQVRAELVFGGRAVHSIAIHRADRRLAAWWGMSSEGRALTHPITLAAGDYFVHVAAAPPPPASPTPYRVRLVAGDLGTCASGASATHVEREEAASPRANDVVAIDWYAFPRASSTGAVDAPEASAIVLEAGQSRVIEGSSAAAASAGDGYLDRDAFAFTAGAATREVRVLLEHTSADVNLDVFVFAEDASRLAGTGVEVGDSPERAAIPVEPGRTYWLWIGARDERAIGGDTALPLAYRATLCGVER